MSSTTHVLIACTAYLGAALLHNTLQLLAFAAYWLWPLRIASYTTVVALALTVRAHLRVADPRHWEVTRWGVALAALMAIAVPLGQTWISSKRLTHIQVMGSQPQKRHWTQLLRPSDEKNGLRNSCRHRKTYLYT